MATQSSAGSLVNENALRYVFFQYHLVNFPKVYYLIRCNKDLDSTCNGLSYRQSYTSMILVHQSQRSRIASHKTF